MKLQDKKRINAILFFAGKSPDYQINRLKLMKLLWITDRIHLNRYGRMILRDQYYALPHGPIPSKTTNWSNENIDDVFLVEDYKLTAEDNFNSKYFSKSDLNVMEEVWEKLGRMNESNLRNYSHRFPEWLRFEKELEDENRPDGYPMVIDDFFTSPIMNTGYDHNNEQSEIAKDIFKQHNTIQDALS